MAEMKDSGIEWIGKIPEDWKVLKNKYNFELSKEIIGTKWVETQLLSLTKCGIIAINDGEQTGKVPASLSTYQKVNKDDIVMCLFDLDCSAVFSGISNWDGMISPAYKCIKCKSHLFPKYIDYYFRTVFVDRKYKRYSKNVRFSISADEFMNLPIIVPPMNIQNKIAEFLNSKCCEIDRLHSDIEKQIEILEEYKKSIITEAVTKGLNPDVEMKDSGIEWIGMIPKHWKIYRYKHLANLVRGGSPRPAGNPIYYYGDIPFMKVADITKDDRMYVDSCEGSIKPAGLSNTRMVNKGTLLLTNSGATLGVPKILNIDTTINDGIAAFLNLSNKLNIKFAYYSLKSKTKYFLQVAALGMGQPNLNTDIIGNTYVTIPPKYEQQKIVDFLDVKCAEIDDIIADKKKQLETLKQYKKSLIYEYVTGKKEVPDNE